MRDKFWEMKGWEFAGKTSGRGEDGHQYLLNVKNISIKSSWAPEFSYIETLHWSHLRGTW